MLNALHIKGYAGAKDYAVLAELSKKSSIICIFDYESGRDVARTQYMSKGVEEYWSVSSRGMCYISEFSREEFIKQCIKAHLVFLDPGEFAP